MRHRVSEPELPPNRHVLGPNQNGPYLLSCRCLRSDKKSTLSSRGAAVGAPTRAPSWNVDELETPDDDHTRKLRRGRTLVDETHKRHASQTSSAHNDTSEDAHLLRMQGLARNWVLPFCTPTCRTGRMPPPARSGPTTPKSSAQSQGRCYRASRCKKRDRHDEAAWTFCGVPWRDFATTASARSKVAQTTRARPCTRVVSEGLGACSGARKKSLRCEAPVDPARCRSEAKTAVVNWVRS